MARFGLAGLVLLGLVMACSRPAESAGWKDWPVQAQEYPAAQIYTQPGDDGARVIVITEAALRDAGGPAFGLDGDPHERLALALGTLWIDTAAYPVEASRNVASEPVLSGMAMTEDGERAFAAVLSGRGEVRVLLAPAAEFARLGGARALEPGATLPPPREAPAASPPAARKARPDAAVAERPEILPSESGVAIAGWVPYGGGGALIGPPEDRPGDPRVARVDVSAGSVANSEEALQAVLDATGTTLIRTTGFREVLALPDIDGNPGWLIAGTARRDGRRHRFTALVGRYNDSGGWYVTLFQAPEPVYTAWGGPAFFLQISGHSLSDVLTPDIVATLDETTPEQDVQFADMIITMSIQMLFAQMNATMGMVMSMQGLGQDIQTRTDCIMTAGCVPGTDNQGRTIMTFPND